MTQSSAPHIHRTGKSAKQSAAGKTCRERRGAEQANTAGEKERTGGGDH